MSENILCAPAAEERRDIPAARRSRRYGVENCYEHVIHHSRQEDRVEALKILKRLERERKSISLINYYRDVPVEHTGRVIEVDGDEAVIETSELQVRLINLQRTTILRSGTLGLHMLTEVRHVDPEKRTATIGNPRYIRLHSDRRNAVRVQLKRPIAIVMEVCVFRRNRPENLT